MTYRYELHPGYGAVPGDGETVAEGEVLGLSVDGATTVTAPASGCMRLVQVEAAGTGRLFAEILPLPGPEIEAGARPALEATSTTTAFSDH